MRTYAAGVTDLNSYQKGKRWIERTDRVGIKSEAIQVGHRDASLLKILNKVLRECDIYIFYASPKEEG